MISKLLFCCLSAIMNFVTPEQFGAKGDGSHDDSYAFSECIKRCETIRLTKDKIYLIGSPVKFSDFDSFKIEGNGATIVIGGRFSPKQYDYVFRFSDEKKLHHEMSVTDLQVLSLISYPESRRNENRGTYVFFSGNCEKVHFEDVVFRDQGAYSNVSFLVSSGGNLVMKRCRIESLSESFQGGAVWYMNKYSSESNLLFEDVHIAYDTNDESVCVANIAPVPAGHVNISAEFLRCNFKSRGNAASSGAVRTYYDTGAAEASISCRFNRCKFSVEGNTTSTICGLWAVDSDYPVCSKLENHFFDCDFSVNTADQNRKSLFQLFPKSVNSIQCADAGYYFDNCRFAINSRATSLISDNDGITKGCYFFKNCNIISDGNLFCRRSNLGESDIRIHVDSCIVKSGDAALSSENFSSSHSEFYNLDGKPLTVHSYGFNSQKSDINIVGCKINGVKCNNVGPNTYPLSVLFYRYEGDEYFSNVCQGECLNIPIDGRDFFVYYYIPVTNRDVFCRVNGKKIKLTYLESSDVYFANIGLRPDLFRYGKNTISISDNNLNFSINNSR